MDFVIDPKTMTTRHAAPFPQAQVPICSHYNFSFETRTIFSPKITRHWDWKYCSKCYTAYSLRCRKIKGTSQARVTLDISRILGYGKRTDIFWIAQRGGYDYKRILEWNLRGYGDQPAAWGSLVDDDMEWAMEIDWIMNT
jgi:hypothetical protein